MRLGVWGEVGKAPDNRAVLAGESLSDRRAVFGEAGFGRIEVGESLSDHRAVFG